MNFDLNSMSRDSLRKLASARSITGRSKMNAEELRTAVRVAVQCSPSPLTYEARVANYRGQNGSNKLTARQSRRLGRTFYTSNV